MQALAPPPSAFVSAFNNTVCQATPAGLVLPSLPTEDEEVDESKRDADG
jgi:hypothetical protein